MVLAFLIDQLQLICCDLYQDAKRKNRTFSSLWEKMRSLFCYIEMITWKDFLEIIARKKHINSS